MEEIPDVPKKDQRFWLTVHTDIDKSGWAMCTVVGFPYGAPNCTEVLIYGETYCVDWPLWKKNGWLRLNRPSKGE